MKQLLLIVFTVLNTGSVKIFEGLNNLFFIIYVVWGIIVSVILLYWFRKNRGLENDNEKIRTKTDCEYVCNDCYKFFDYNIKTCTNCGKTGKINNVVMATNDAGYRQFMAECEQEDDFYELGIGFVGLFEKDKFVGFFKSKLEAKDFAANNDIMTTTSIKTKTGRKWSIWYDEIEKISFPVFKSHYVRKNRYETKRAGDSFRFTITTKDRKSITLVTGNRNPHLAFFYDEWKNRDLKRAMCYKLYSRLIVSCRLFYRHYNERKINLPLLVPTMALIPFLLTTGVRLAVSTGTTIAKYITLGLLMILPFVIIWFILDTFFSLNCISKRLFFTSNNNMAMYEQILPHEIKRKKTERVLWIFVIITCIHLFAIFMMFGL